MAFSWLFWLSSRFPSSTRLPSSVIFTAWLKEPRNTFAGVSCALDVVKNMQLQGFRSQLRRTAKHPQSSKAVGLHPLRFHSRALVLGSLWPWVVERRDGPTGTQR